MVNSRPDQVSETLTQKENTIKDMAQVVECLPPYMRS
jgi:hypothetical protein